MRGRWPGGASTTRSSTTSCRRCRFDLFFDDAFDFVLIAFLVGLRARAVHGRALAAIEQAKLEARGVDGASHGAAERVDFADDLPLADATNRRIAAHLSDGIEADGEQRRACAQACRGQRRFGAGMPRADHHHIVIVVSRLHCIRTVARPIDTRMSTVRVITVREMSRTA